MPGTVIFKPLSAKLTRNTEFFGKMDPYCRVTLGKQKLESQVCRNGGKHPRWEDTLVFKRKNEPVCHVELKEKDWLLPDDLIGGCDINLNEVEQQKRVLKWYPMNFKGKPVGQVLLEISYEPEKTGQEPNKVIAPIQPTIQENIQQPPVVKQEQYIPAPRPQEVHPQQGMNQQQQYQGCYPTDVHPQQFHQGVHQEMHYPTHQQQFPPQQYQQYQHHPQQNVEGADKYPQLNQNQANMWAPSYHEVHQDSNYPQKYPQFDQNYGVYHPNK